MDKLKISYIQTHLHWENPDENLNMLSDKIRGISETTDLIILPEMFSTGFSMNTALAETLTGKTMIWLKEMADQKAATIIGSVMILDGTRYFNRLLVAHPNGKLEYYDKRHLFSYGHENNHYTAGKKRLQTTIQSWEICPLICYDLRFPAWSRNNTGYDLLIYTANWPSARAHAWRSLLIARAIENQSYVIGLNRTGDDGNGLDYSGGSMVIDYQGHILYESGVEEDIVSTELNLSIQREFRLKFPFLKDQDHFLWA